MGVTVLTPEFFRLYPDIQFQFKLPKHLAGTYYGHRSSDGKSCWLSTDMPGDPDLTTEDEDEDEGELV